MKNLFKIGGILVAAGIIVFAIALMAVGGDFSKLSSKGAYAEREYVTDNVTRPINLTDISSEIEVGESQDDKIYVYYGEREKDTYLITEGEQLNIARTLELGWLASFSFFDFEMATIRILVPKNYDQQIKLNTTNGNVEIKGVSASDIKVDTTNSNIEMSRIQASENIELKTTNGDIELGEIAAHNIEGRSVTGKISARNTEARGQLFLEVINGDIEVVSVVVAKGFEGKTTKGDIKGTIAGQMQDFTIRTKAVNGKNTLPESYPAGSKYLKLGTINGEIGVSFLN